jgi:hypothetical protein
LRTGQDVRLSQSKNVPLKESFKTPYPPNPPLIHTDERTLRLDVPNAQTATEIPADPKQDQPESAIISLASPRAQTSALNAPSKHPYQSGIDGAPMPLQRSLPEPSYFTHQPSEWGDDSALGTSVASFSGYETLTRSPTESNYSYEKTDKPDEWGDDSTLGTSVASISGHQRLIPKQSAPEQNYFEKAREPFMKKPKHKSNPPARIIPLPTVMPENLGFLRQELPNFQPATEIPADSKLDQPVSAPVASSTLRTLAVSSKSKGKSKEGKYHKPTSKSTTSSKQTISANEEPGNLGFLYTIDALEAIYDEKHPSRNVIFGGTKGNSDIYHLWFPPNRAKMFKRQKGNVYRWRAGHSQLLEGYRRPEKNFHVASVFFQAKQNNFLAVFKDCTKSDIADETPGWTQIGFHHHSGYMSEVDLFGERDQLAAPANGSTWMPQVVPEVYNYDKNPALRFTGEPGGLCGKLSLLIAMAAFSAEVRNAENVVATCFGLGIWRKHQFEIGIGRMSNYVYSEK